GPPRPALTHPGVGPVRQSRWVPEPGTGRRPGPAARARKPDPRRRAVPGRPTGLRRRSRVRHLRHHAPHLRCARQRPHRAAPHPRAAHPRGHLGPEVGAVAVDAAAVIRRLGERRRGLLALTARRSAVAPVIVLAVTATASALAAISPLDPLAAHLGSAYQFTGSAGREAAHTALGLSVHGIGRTRGGPHGAGPGHPVVAGLVAVAD